MKKNECVRICYSSSEQLIKMLRLNRNNIHIFRCVQCSNFGRCVIDVAFQKKKTVTPIEHSDIL